MTRLYIDKSLVVGERVTLPPEELRYFKSIKRQSGDVILFNRQGQIARGQVEDACFVVLSVEASSRRLFDLSVAVGAPERQVLDELIRSLSEIGLKRLIVFKADRSQAQNFKNLNRERLERLCIESMRQSERPEPLQIQFVENFKQLSLSDYQRIWLCDEAPLANQADQDSSAPALYPALIIIGPEGGWSSPEREAMRAFLPSAVTQYVHLDGPIMRVHTAAIAFVGGYLKNEMSKCVISVEAR